MLLTSSTICEKTDRMINVIPDRCSSAIGSDAKDASVTFDGVICFGGVDWWYHNRGHFDLQMMAQLSRSVPVLYVNSIGMRVPRVDEGRVFARRLLRKLNSIRRGFVAEHERFGVLTPFTAPGKYARSLTRLFVKAQIIAACKQMNIINPLIWVACPPAVEIIDELNTVGVVYQRTDRFEAFPGVDIERVLRHDHELKQRADLTVFCSRSLSDNESEQCRAAAFIDHGVDYDRFASPGTEPADLESIAHPRVGFVGGIDAHTFDPRLFVETADRLPDVNFVMVGDCSLPGGWCDPSNVHFLGRKPYEEVCDYMAACDVLIMPWNRGDWIQACNPVKLKEYLAVGRPVVSTWFPELDYYEPFIRIANDASEFAEQISDAIESPGIDPGQQERVRNETWTAKAKLLLEELIKVGLKPQQELSHA